MISLSGAVVAGCAVPRGAPSRREVLSDMDAPQADFALELVTRDRLPVYAQWGHDATHVTANWPAGGAVPQDQRLAPGDQLALRIWDAGESSLITAPGAQFADVSNVVVTGSGHVDLPYIDSVHVGGLTLQGARAHLQDKLTAIMPSAQVQVEVVQGRRNSVDVLGGVASPGSYPLKERNLPLTSLLASAGGVVNGLQNPQVQITRGGDVFRRPLRQILEKPALDAALRGGDRVLVTADPRSFKAIGAAGREDVIGFDADTVTALRAISLMGGMDDSRADPKGILVMRRYTPERVNPETGPPHTHVVFSFDLTSASGMFSADEFPLYDGDIVMATQSPATTTQRVLGLFGSFMGFGRTVSNL
ncbi:polysaccharide biosynthesis/export family protein [Roseinatronobacter sp. NSM]|uniref:polysaccharide biosynthesis/export family protein n=1 Tax=Roseinatronobacter sp. NSM TaxID=3457785 RepID=UPI0040371DAE